MIAAQAGRHEVVKFILETSDLTLNMRDRQRMTALGNAAKYGHAKTVQVILEKGGKKSLGVGADRLHPLHWAAARGHYQLAETLIEAKANVCGKDKFKRSPLILAILNGHMRLASLLL